MGIAKEFDQKFDYIVIGSGFGGSVSALRLSQKGYKVLVIEKGKWWKNEDFPKTNWNLRKWLWLPALRFFGFFKITFVRHVCILSGVGVGGGSLVYANTLPRPKPKFFESGSWAKVKNWRSELEPHYKEAEKMLGANINPQLMDSDLALQEVARHNNKLQEFEPTNVAVFFGKPEVEVTDPYFNGKGPDREGCRFCGACMTGCRYNAKNTLDKNYLHLAIQNGVDVMANTKVIDVKTIESVDGKDGYEVTFKKTSNYFTKRRKVSTKGIVFSGGVLGTVRLLLNLKRKSLPRLSNMVGQDIRTNNESLILVASKDKHKDFSKGIAIGSIFPSDENSHIEAVRYGAGSNFWKLVGVPLTHGTNIFIRLASLLKHLVINPISWLRVNFMRNFAERSIILLFMQNLDSKVKFTRGMFGMKSKVTSGPVPSAFMPEAKKLADQTAEVINGKPMVMATEALTGIPTTAHILGGAVIGDSPEMGVIDKNHQVYGYQNMYVCDGSAISANPGVNPALTITAMSELAMSGIRPTDL